MKTRVLHSSNNRGSEASVDFVIESPADLELAINRLKALNAGQKDESISSEARGLQEAIDSWKAKQRCS